MPRRQVRALAKSSMWKNKLLGAVLTGMGQIPIERGSGDSGALNRAIEELARAHVSGSTRRALARSVERCGLAAASATWRGRCPRRRSSELRVTARSRSRGFPGTPARASRFLRVRSTGDRAGGVTAAVQHPVARPTPSPGSNRSRGPQALRGARRPRPHLVAGAGDHRQARRQGRARGGARPSRRGARPVSWRPQRDQRVVADRARVSLRALSGRAEPRAAHAYAAAARAMASVESGLSSVSAPGSGWFRSRGSARGRRRRLSARSRRGVLPSYRAARGQPRLSVRRGHACRRRQP